METVTDVQWLTGARIVAIVFIPLFIGFAITRWRLSRIKKKFEKKFPKKTS